MSAGRLRRPPAGGPGSTARGLILAILAGLLAAGALGLVIDADECAPLPNTVCDETP